MSAPTRTSHWVPVTGRQPCEACGKPDYCTRSADGSVVKCMRVPSPNVIKNRDLGDGYLHRVAELGKPIVTSKPQQAKPKMKPAEIEAILKRNKGHLSLQVLKLASERLRVSEKSLLAYGAGYDPDRGKLSFPMFDGQVKPIGIHLRAQDGDKKCVPGSRNGLFVPNDYDDTPLPEGLVDDDTGPLLLLTPEGLTDCCAARDAGFRAIGRPSNSGGAKLLVDLLSRHKSAAQDVVVMGEREETHHLPDGTPYWPGIEGPLAIIGQLLSARVCGKLRFAMPPMGRGKDLREWLTVHNAPAAELMCVIHKAKPVDGRILNAYRRRIEQRKRDERRDPQAVAACDPPVTAGTI